MEKQLSEIQKLLLKNKKIVALVALGIFILAFASGLSLNISYSTGFEGPSAAFTSVTNLSPSNQNFVASGSGHFNFVNPNDNTAWTANYQVGGTSIDVTPTDSTGNIHSALMGEMTGIGFSNGASTPPEKTYSWNITNPASGKIQMYEMAMYPLTWTLNFATSTKNFQHISYYVDNVVNMQISLNQNMWYFSTAPSNVYFGIGAIELTTFQVISNQSNVKTAMIPSAQYSLLTLNSPGNAITASQANGQSASSIFASYEGAALNPMLFAPSVTTSITISDLAPTAVRNLNGVFTGQDASVHMVFKVDTFVVGVWSVQPPFHGTGGHINPQTSVPGASIFQGILGGLGDLNNALLNNPLASFLILLVIAGVGIVILIVFFPELAKALSGAASRKINSGAAKKKSG